MTSIDWIAIIGAMTGIIGTVLGVISMCDLLNKNRVKLRVTPGTAWASPSGAVLSAHTPAAPEHDPVGGRPPNRLAIEVVNLSSFAVTISDVGFGRVNAPRRCCLARPELADGRTWPARLESREALTAYCQVPSTKRDRDDFISLSDGVAYAQTQCDTVKYGSSAAFAKFVANRNF